MKIAYNSQIFRMQEYGGISRYVVNLARRVAREEQVVVSAPLYINNYLAELPRELVRGMRMTWRPSRGARLVDWVGTTLDRMIISGVSPDVLHETYYSYRSVAPVSTPKVLTVYDMIHERYSNWFAPNDDTARRKAASVSRASHVICISENTRRDLIDYCRIDPDKVSVVHLGYEVLDEGAVTNTADLTMNNSAPYILYVGDRIGYKNFKALLRAYAGSAWLRANFRLVCFGGGQFRSDELELMGELSIEHDHIEQVGGGDDVLAGYYRNAAAFVYPSLYEGFGIPPLEAMALGCPVICSNTSSIPEVVGDAGEYFDPEQDEAIRV